MSERVVRHVDEIKFTAICPECWQEYKPVIRDAVEITEKAVWNTPNDSDYTLVRYVKLEDYSTLKQRFVDQEQSLNRLEDMYKNVLKDFEEVEKELEELRAQKSPEEKSGPGDGG